MKSEVAVIGSSNVDMLMHADRLPEKGETITGASYMQVFGGKNANQAVACARAGTSTVFVNAMGNDPYADRMLDHFKADGIDCSSMLHFQDVPSGHALCMTGEHGSNYLMVAPGANMKLTPEELVPLMPRLERIPIWLLQCEIPAESNYMLLERARELSVRVIWNYAPAVQADNPPLDCCDTLVVNELEASQLSGMPVDGLEAAVGAASALRSKGVIHVVITLGRDGLYYKGEGEELRMGIYDVEAIDTIAAGDTFCGALASQLAAQAGWSRALLFANAAANLSVTSRGAQPSIPRKEAIEAFLAKHPNPII